MLTDKQFKCISIGLITVWLLLLALLPFLFIFFASFLTTHGDHFIAWNVTIANYRRFFSVIYLHVFMHSLGLSAITTIICLLIAYPFAFILATTKSWRRVILLLLAIVPLWTSSLIRTYAIVAIIQANGLLNRGLLWLGIIDQPLQLLYTSPAVVIGLVYSLLPFMILPLYVNIEQFDWQLIEAARDLGASNWPIFSKIILPLTASGIIAGSILVFLPAMTMFYIPDILGGAKSLLLGNVIRDEFLILHDWPMGAAISMSLIILMIGLLFFYWRFSRHQNKSYLL